MPSSTLGWTRLEIINKITDSMGRSNDATVRARLAEDINFAQLSFWKEFNWKFGNRSGLGNNLRLLLVASTSEYTLDTATIGAVMRNTEIAKIYNTDSAYSRTLIKAYLGEIRETDPENSRTGFPTHYATVSHDKIKVWPTPTATEAGKYLYIDGKVQPTFLTADGDYPDVPIEYQETFIQYLFFRALSRERDPRQSEELAIYDEMLKRDKRFDMRELENNARLKHASEMVEGKSIPTIGERAWFSLD